MNSASNGMQAVRIAVLLATILWIASPAASRDTDVYSINTKQNAYVLMDNSKAMGYGVYEHSIDYGEMFDYLFTLNDQGDVRDYIWDTITNSSIFYRNHSPMRTIFLWRGKIGVTIANIDGESVAISGDAADPAYLWYSGGTDFINTRTMIDADGNLAPDGSGLPQRLTVDANGYVRLDGALLPLGLSIKEHEYTTLFNGTVIDTGFAGLLTAPGYYFSGYKGLSATSLNPTALDPVEDGDQYVYFFVTGNWANMQAMYNLTYYRNTSPRPAGANLGDDAWRFEHFPLTTPASWSQIGYTLDYPAGPGNYSNNLTEAATTKSIVQPGARKIQIHFAAFDVQGNGNAATYTNDSLRIYDQTGALVVTYDNDNSPTLGDGWSPVINGNTASLRLRSNASIQGKGYFVDRVRVVDNDLDGPSYLMQTRMDVAKDAMSYVVEEFQGKMNWGLATLNGVGGGATIWRALDPSQTDEAQRTALLDAIANDVFFSANPNAPLMGAMQDVWQRGFHNQRHLLDSLLCRKNYVISMSSGYPAGDTQNKRITTPTAVTFADWDDDRWTSDPYRPPVAPNYYDDVAHWMYTHSWMDGSLVDDPEHSYVNVITHHIAFSSRQPLMEDAAGESGGQYIVANNKQQLVAAFYSLALQMGDAVSFTAPVVSTDAANKIQSGDDLYMGLFLPRDSGQWLGNLKKFKMGDGSADRPKLFTIYDRANHEAIDANGNFLDNTAAFWGDDSNPNDSDHYGAADIREDGAGEVLLEDVQGYFDARTYWKRPIYTSKGGNMVKFERDNITAADLGVADNATRDKLINYTHGYTYAAAPETGDPIAVREWILGPIIHSQPVVIDYYNTADPKLPLVQRLIAVGSNDGMLHVFDDGTGREVFAFIPEDILPKLRLVQSSKLHDTVDGAVTLYRKAKNPHLLIFGERRGGSHFWSLDITSRNPLDWTVAWTYTNSEISQSWSEVKTARIPVAVDANGRRTYRDVAIFTGGYDPEEDFYPEPFTDQNLDGTPFKDDGSVDPGEWSAGASSQDVNLDTVYNTYNPGMNETGRGIFVVDIENPTAVTTVTLADGVTTRQVLPFSITYGPTPASTGGVRKSPEMRFSFPASPSVVTGTDTNLYKAPDGPATSIQPGVLLSAYAVDVYANLFKAVFAFEVTNTGSEKAPNWKVAKADWTVNRVFSSNPGSTSGSGSMGGGIDAVDVGRKAFYSPTVSWGGSKGLFESGNYYFPGVEFQGTKGMASLFFGTGDRENPKYGMIRNRMYAIYDDSSVTAEQSATLPATPAAVTVTSAPYQENDLLNLTCDELGKNSIINTCYLGALDGRCDSSDIDGSMKTYLKELLTDDAVYGTPSALEQGQAHENDAKGWYIVLADQGKSSVCGHMTYPTAITADTGTAHDNHAGEQVLSQPLLYYDTLYFTTYQPSINDPCHPQGNGFSYALEYLHASAAYNLYQTVVGTTDIADRYKKRTAIQGIPSGFNLFLRKGRAAAMASMGGGLVGPAPESNQADGNGDGGGDANSPSPFEIKSPVGLHLYYWRDSASQE